MKVLYRREQNVPNNNSFSQSAGKPLLVMERFSTYPIEISDFEPLKREQIYVAHSKDYVDGVLDLKINNGFRNCLPAVAASLLYTTGSFYAASKFALQEGVAISPTSGFHHAGYSFGGGFCTFNGLMISAILLKNEKLVSKIGIIDFDEHWGNGTYDIILEKKIDYVSHMSFSSQRGNDHNIWLRKLRRMLLDKFLNVDVLFYQAGADPHVDDPLGGELTTEQMIERDSIVFEFAKKFNKPIVWNLAGGYQTPLFKVIDLHENTLKECLKVFG